MKILRGALIGVLVLTACEIVVGMLFPPKDLPAAPGDMSGTLGVAQIRPKLMPLIANAASSDATARSHCATSWQPAAVASAWCSTPRRTARRCRAWKRS